VLRVERSSWTSRGCRVVFRLCPHSCLAHPTLGAASDSHSQGWTKRTVPPSFYGPIRHLGRPLEERDPLWVYLQEADDTYIYGRAPTETKPQVHVWPKVNIWSGNAKFDELMQSRRTYREFCSGPYIKTVTCGTKGKWSSGTRREERGLQRCTQWLHPAE
jgi:hypothetical protein